AAWLAGGVGAVEAMVSALPEGADDAAPARRRVLVHASGFRQSPYADIKPAGADPGRPPAQQPPSKLWHSSPGSSGW
ncbi:MAG: hypothetical protein ACYC0W_13375, partial [Candidatus Nanopelagicales bacterium]